MRDLVQGAAPAGRPGEDAAERSRGVVSRRADLRPGSGRRSRGPWLDRGAWAWRGDDLSDHTSLGGGRAAVRPRRDRQYDRADDRSSRRAPRPIVRHVAHGQHARPACRAGQCVRRASGVDGWTEQGAGRYVLAVSEATVAAPAVVRALVAAGADVLSIGESHHSLEDVYLEWMAEGAEVQRRRR